MSGGTPGIVNPMVHNMAPAYAVAKYEIVWISTSRILGKYFHVIHVTANVSILYHTLLDHQETAIYFSYSKSWNEHCWVHCR